jgi:hypothetical protein
MKKSKVLLGNCYEFNIYDKIDMGRVIDLGPRCATLKLNYGYEKIKLVKYSKIEQVGSFN